MIAHDIPQHFQVSGSTDCGPVCTLMILDFFGVTTDRQAVLKKIQRSEWGTSTFANAHALHDYGLETTLVTIQPKIFHGEFIRSEPSRKQTLEKVLAVAEDEKVVDKKHNLLMLADYLKTDGRFKLAIPTKRMIIDALKSGKLVWLSTYTKILGEKEGSYHAVLVGGYKDNQFLIYNPLPNSRRKSWEDADKVMFAIHSVTTYDYDNGAIIIVGK